MWVVIVAASIAFRSIQSPRQSVRYCDVRIVYNESNRVPDTLQKLPRATDLETLCTGPLRHWDVCRIGLHADRNPITTHNVVTEWKDAWIDSGACHDQVVGYPFTHKCVGMFQWDGYCKHVRHKIMFMRGTVHKYDKLASTLQPYPGAAGHYPAEQLPTLIRLARILPPDVRILTPLHGCPICLRYVQEMVRIGAINQSRLVGWKGRHHVYGARLVYHHRPWPYENGHDPHRGAVLRSPVDLDLVRTTFTRGIATGTGVLLIKRRKSRRATNHKALLSALGSNRTVHIFDKPGPTLRDDIVLFRGSSVIVGVHGAGLMNMMWCAPGTVVIEVCYTSGMPCPHIYYHMAIALGLDYRVSIGKGDYGGDVRYNISDILSLAGLH